LVSANPIKVSLEPINFPDVFRPLIHLIQVHDEVLGIHQGDNAIKVP
jgi:hypothetical protein